MRTKSYPTAPAFLIDVGNADVDYGGHIDWAKVPAAAPYLREDNSKTVPAGTLMVRGADGKRYPREVAAAGEKASRITWNSIQQNSKEDSHGAYAMIIGGSVWQNLLAKHHRENANFAAWLAELKTEGTGFSLQTYRDSRAG